MPKGPLYVHTFMKKSRRCCRVWISQCRNWLDWQRMERQTWSGRTVACLLLSPIKAYTAFLASERELTVAKPSIILRPGIIIIIGTSEEISKLPECSHRKCLLENWLAACNISETIFSEICHDPPRVRNHYQNLPTFRVSGHVHCTHDRQASYWVRAFTLHA